MNRVYTFCIKCGKDVGISGSKRQPITYCEDCGMLSENEIISKYKCFYCKKLFNELEGSFDICSNEGCIFICNACGGKLDEMH